MDNLREKLVELLRPWLAHLSLAAANDLIANGVTVQDRQAINDQSVGISNLETTSKCMCCIHKEACLAWIRHGKALYEDFVFSTDDCPYFEVATDNNVPTKWIPVTERLPVLHTDDYEEPDGSRVQLEESDDQWVITTSGYQTKARYETGVVFQGWVGEYGQTVRDVTHWMPLPEPPEEG